MRVSTDDSCRALSRMWRGFPQGSRKKQTSSDPCPNRHDPMRESLPGDCHRLRGLSSILTRNARLLHSGHVHTPSSGSADPMSQGRWANSSKIGPGHKIGRSGKGPERMFAYLEFRVKGISDGQTGPLLKEHPPYLF